MGKSPRPIQEALHRLHLNVPSGRIYLLEFSVRILYNIWPLYFKIQKVSRKRTCIGNCGAHAVIGKWYCCTGASQIPSSIIMGHTNYKVFSADGPAHFRRSQSAMTARPLTHSSHAWAIQRPNAPKAHIVEKT